MNPSVRHVAFVAALLSSAAGAVFIGCAESPTFPDDGTSDGDGKSTPKPSGKDATVPDDDDDPILDDDADVADDDADVADDDGGGGADACTGICTDAGKDAGKDAGSSDAGTDAGKDAGTSDAGTDAGKDAGGGDAGVDAGPDDDDDGGVLKPSKGEIVISEVMFNPSTKESDTEWFEVYNTSTEERRLSGLTIKDKLRTHVIAGGVRIQPGAYVLLVRSRAEAEGVGLPSGAIVYEYGPNLSDSKAIVLANDKDAVLSLSDGENVIAHANYGSFSMSKNGASVQLKVLDEDAVDDKSNWCVPENAWAGVDQGTPGSVDDCE